MERSAVSTLERLLSSLPLSASAAILGAACAFGLPAACQEDTQHEVTIYDKDGGEHKGYIAERTPTKIVLQDASGHKVEVLRATIDSIVEDTNSEPRKAVPPKAEPGDADSKQENPVREPREKKPRVQLSDEDKYQVRTSGAVWDAEREAQKKNYAQAIIMMEQLISRTVEGHHQTDGRWYCRIGEYHYAMALNARNAENSAKAADEYRQALDAYLKGMSLVDQDSWDFHDKATNNVLKQSQQEFKYRQCAFIGRCYEGLADSGNDQNGNYNKALEWYNRAIKEWDENKGDSLWCKRAIDIIQKTKNK